jgi:hypothetical protein
MLKRELKDAHNYELVFNRTTGRRRYFYKRLKMRITTNWFLILGFDTVKS